MQVASIKRDAKGARPRLALQVIGGSKQSAEGLPVARKVLLVEDERDTADLAELLLRAHGFEVRVAYSAAAALSVLSAEPDIDALFSDVMMPGMNGFELAQIVEQTYPRIKIVMTSGFTALSVRKAYQSEHAFVVKPYSMAEVVKLLS